MASPPVSGPMRYEFDMPVLEKKIQDLLEIGWGWHRKLHRFARNGVDKPDGLGVQRLAWEDRQELFSEGAFGGE